MLQAETEKMFNAASCVMSQYWSYRKYIHYTRCSWLLLISHWGEGNDIQESMQALSLFFLHDSTTVLGFPIPTQVSFIHPPLLPRNDIFPHAQSSSFFTFTFLIPFLRCMLQFDLMWELRTVHYYTSVLSSSIWPPRRFGFFSLVLQNHVHTWTCLWCVWLCI